MSAVIKSRLLRSLNVLGEYVIESGDIAQEQEMRRQMAEPPEVRAKSIIELAEEEARALISAARQEADSIRTMAYQDGFQTPQSEFASERAALAERVAQTIEDIQAQVEQFWISMEPELLTLAVDIARKVIHREVSETQDVILNMVKIALHQIRDRQLLKIRVNPADYELLREHKEEIMGSCDGMRDLEILEDRRVEQGGCLIESDNGNLDARIGTQLREIEKALLEAARDGRHDVAAQTG